MHDQNEIAREQNNDHLTRYTAEIVSAHVSHNRIETGELTELIQQVYNCLSSLEKVGQEQPSKPLEPAVPISKSVKQDYIICLEDGKKLKVLKRHLKTAYNMTPEEYRERWGLRSDYPMVAPSYAEKRSNLAKNFGLGRTFRKKSKAGATKKAVGK